MIGGIETPISTAELERRWAAARAAMADAGVDVLVMQATNDWLGGCVKWLTDIPATNGYPRSVAFFTKEPMVIVEMGPAGMRRAPDGRDRVHRGVGTFLFSPAFASVAATHADDARLLAGALLERDCRTVGMHAEGAMAFGFSDALHRAMGSGTVFVDLTNAIDAIKAVKSAEELGLIAATAKLQDEVFARILDTIRPGMRDADVAALAWHEGQRLGSEQGIILGASAPIGEPSVFRGRHFQGRTLEAGDHISILIEINGPGGFYTELARTIVLGVAPQALRDGFARMREAQDLTLSLIRPGADCREISASHDAFMARHGLPAELRLYAHGQGYDMVERPLIRGGESMALSTGMCLAVHPGYEDSRQFSVICDNYVVGGSGPGPCLHRTEKTIFEVV